MSGFNLIIDGNYILYKNLFALHKTKTLYTDLPMALKSNFNRITHFGNIDKVWTVVDSKISWRKKMYPTYKAKRTKDDTIDWDWVWNTHQEFLDSTNSTVIREEGLEGDDIVAILVDKINALGGSCLLISDDKDFRQFVKWGLSETEEAYINIMWNDSLNPERERAIIPYNLESFTTYIKSNRGSDLLFSGHDWEGDNRVLKILDKIMTKNTVAVNNREVIFRKLLEGDTGDNVDSALYETQNLKDGGTREIGIGEATSFKVWEKFLGMELPDTDDFNLELMAKLLLDVKKLDHTKKEEVIKKLEDNRKLMVLQKGYIPTDLWDITESKINF